MKKLFFLISLFISIYSFGQFPPEFPSNLKNKVFCGKISVYGQKYMSSDIDFGTNTNFDYKIYISESEGIYVEYNPGQKFGRDKMGTTEKLKNLTLWKKEPYVSKDKYGDITGESTFYYYKLYPDTKKDHYIKEIVLTIYKDGFKFVDGGIAKGYSCLNVTINVPYHQDATIRVSSDEIECERLKTKAEIEKQEQDRIKLESQKKDADKTTLLKINDLISKNSLEDAAKEYSKLNFVNSEMKGILQQKLEVKFGEEVIQLNPNNVEDYIKANKSKLNSINPGNYKINFDKNGWSSNGSFPYLSNIPEKIIGKFRILSNSQAEIQIVKKDSILVSSTFSTSNTKPLFIDKNENFYFKTKTGLPTATISNNPEIDKKLVRINKTYKREKYANGILIDSQEFKTEKTVGIMKKD
jgi:hypothetical protein